MQRLVRDCPSPRGRLSLGLHCDDGVARNVLRCTMVTPTRGEPAGRHLAHIFRAAVGYENFVIHKKADHWHVFFTRTKSNGIECRLIVDGTGADHPNAINSRLPEPPTPPAMMRVGTVVLVLVDCDHFGVDDVRTAFAQMGLCDIMQRAHGVAVITRGGSVIRGRSTRVIQGGTWSAACCQHATLLYALPEADRPPREAGEVGRDHATCRKVGVDYITACVRARRMVHVDDVMSGGYGPDPTALDERRRLFREAATAAYGVVWKNMTLSDVSGVAVGVHIDCTAKTWGLDPGWVAQLVEALGRLRGREWSEESRQWFRGVTVWVAQVLHTALLPMYLLETDREAALDLLVMTARSRAGYRRRLTPEQAMRPYPRMSGERAYCISDACGTGASGAATDGTTAYGPWKWCAHAGRYDFGETCAESTPTYVPPQHMTEAEAAASARVAVQMRGTTDRLVISDSKDWVDAMARGHSRADAMGLYVAAATVLATGQWSVAHVDGRDNTADGPSRGVPSRFVVSEDVPHPPLTGRPRWTIIGVAQWCGMLEDGIRRVLAKRLPCSWSGLLQPTGRPCIAGCLH